MRERDGPADDDLSRGRLPSANSFLTSAAWAWLSLALAPPTRPRARTAARPSLVFSTISSRRYSSKAAKMWNCRRPPAVVVATVEWTMESNLYAQLQRSCTLGRDIGFQPGPHASIAQFEILI